MIKKVANAILDAGEGCQSGLVYVDPVEAAKAAIAVLETDAEPVAWYWEDSTGCFHITLDRADVVELAKSVGCTPRPLFSAPGETSRFFAQPTPSVAVKALLDEVWNAAVEQAAAIANDCVHLTPDPGAAIKAMLNGRAKLYPASEAALSAQVQDVAGWQSMDSAPKDGKHCLLAVKSDCFVYAVQGAFMMGEWHNAADIKSEPLCWMPLTRIPQVFLPWTDEFAAAAPAAKMEEKQ